MIITTVSRKAQTWWPPKWWQRGRKRHRMFSGIACIGTSWPAPADGRHSRGRSRRGSRSGGSGSSSWTSSGRSLCCGGWTSPKSPFSSRQKIGWNNWRSKEAPRAIIHWQDLQWSQYPFTPTGARHAVKTCLRYMLLLFFVVFNKLSFFRILWHGTCCLSNHHPCQHWQNSIWRFLPQSHDRWMDFADFVTSRRLTLAMIAAPVVNKSIFYKLLTWIFDLFLTPPNTTRGWINNNVSRSFWKTFTRSTNIKFNNLWKWTQAWHGFGDDHNQTLAKRSKS